MVGRLVDKFPTILKYNIIQNGNNMRTVTTYVTGEVSKFVILLFSIM